MRIVHPALSLIGDRAGSLPLYDFDTWDGCIQNVYMAVSTPTRKPIGVRATPKERAIIRRAAAREGRSVNSFVLGAALRAAEKEASRTRRSPEEVMKIVRAAQEEVRRANPQRRNLVDELIQQRRREAAND